MSRSDLIELAKDYHITHTDKKTRDEIIAELKTTGVVVRTIAQAKRSARSPKSSPRGSPKPRKSPTRKSSPKRQSSPKRRNSPKRQSSPKAKSRTKTPPRKPHKKTPPASPRAARVARPLTPPGSPRIATGMSCLDESKVNLRPHQIKVVKHMLEHRSLLVVADAGSGKTLMGVASANCILAENPDARVIGVFPLSLIENFRKEMRKFGMDPYDERVQLMSFDKFALEMSKGNIDCRNALVIIDEAHNLRTNIMYNAAGKCSEGKKAAHVLSCTKDASWRLLLTATPVVNSPSDVRNLIAMLDGDRPLSILDFNNMLEEDDPDVMKAYFGNKIMFYTVDKSNENYPELIEHDVLLEMSDDYYLDYMSIESSAPSVIAKSVFGDDIDLSPFFNGVRRAVNNLYDEDSPKVKWALEKILEGEQTLICSSFKSAGVDLLTNALDVMEIPYGSITGESTLADRKKAVEDYNKGITKVFLITKAGGEGLDLKKTRNVIMLEPYWNRAVEIQFMYRAARYKSHTSLPKEEQRVDVFHLYLTKPKLGKGKAHQMESIDLYLKQHQDDKTLVLDSFVTTLKSYGI